jgi:stage II sporulation protein D
VFTGSGNGHQVGMSQYGANAMAKLGFSYDQIVEFYFPGIEVGLYKK